MDPFSIFVGSIALTETANKVARRLIDTYRDFKAAPEEMLEIADQVTFCSGLVDIFAKSVEATGQKFPMRFREDVTTLVDKYNIILAGIEKMIPDGTRDLNKHDYVRRLRYAFGDKQAIGELQDKLKKVQHMFMFMTTCWMYQLPSIQQQQQQQQQATPSVIPVGSLRGTMEHVPVHITMGNGPGESQTVIYEATLTLNPMQPPPMTSRPENVRSRSSLSERARTKSNAKESLKNMRRSPYFSMNLLRQPRTNMPPFGFGNAEASLHRKDHGELKTEKMRYKEEVLDKTKSREEASQDVDQIISDWFSEDQEDSSEDASTALPSFDEQPSINRSTPYHYRPQHEPFDSNEFLGSATDTTALRPPDAAIYTRSWLCDGCDCELYQGDERYRCQVCPGFDFCPECYMTVRHKHASSSFELRVD